MEIIEEELSKLGFLENHSFEFKWVEEPISVLLILFFFV